MIGFTVDGTTLLKDRSGRGLVIIALLTIASTFTLGGSLGANEKVYRVERMWTEVTVNHDRSIELLYNITFTNEVTSSGSISWITLGMPASGFEVWYVEDLAGRGLSWQSASSDEWFGIRIEDLGLQPGNKLDFVVGATVRSMVFDDEMNPGYAGLQFIPTWWNCPVDEVRLSIVLPEGVEREEIKCTPDWDNLIDRNGRLAPYWERHGLYPDQKMMFGAAFPSKYVAEAPEEDGWPSWLNLTTIGAIVFVGAMFVWVGAIVIQWARKEGYRSPSIAVEALGPRRGLTAVEAAYLLESSPSVILTMILYSVIRKAAAEVTAVKPRLKLRILAGSEKPLRYYERAFIRAVHSSEDGEGYLDELKLISIFRMLRDGVEKKLVGYCRSETVNHYQSIVNRAWQMVEEAQTPELRLEAFDEKLPWLLADYDFERRVGETLEGEERIQPVPIWIWYGLYRRHWAPTPAEAPSSISAERGPSVTEYANAVVTSVENTANAMVENTEKFAKAVADTLMPQQPSPRPVVRHSSCVCACVSCACACACVSCACACASSGAG